MLSELKFIGAVSRGKVDLIIKCLPQKEDVLNEGVKISVLNKNLDTTKLLLDHGADPDGLNMIWDLVKDWSFDRLILVNFVNFTLERVNMLPEEKVRRLLAIDVPYFAQIDKIKSLGLSHLMSENMSFASVESICNLVRLGKLESDDAWVILKERKLTYYELTDLSSLWDSFPLTDVEEYRRFCDRNFYQGKENQEFWDLLEKPQEDPVRLGELVTFFHSDVSQLLFNPQIGDSEKIARLFSRCYDLFHLTEGEIQEIFERAVHSSKWDLALACIGKGAVWRESSFTNFMDKLSGINTFNRQVITESFSKSFKRFAEIERCLLSCENRQIAGEIALEI
jgi:hypothetical protein